MSSLGSILIGVRADYAELKNDLAKALGQIEKFGADGKASSERFGKGLEGIHRHAGEAKLALREMSQAVVGLSGASGHANELANALSHVANAAAFGAGAGMAVVLGTIAAVQLATEASAKRLEVIRLRGEEAAKMGEKLERAFDARGDAAEKYGVSRERQLEKELSALEKEKAFLKVLAEPPDDLKKLFEAINSARDRANEMDKDGTFDSKKKAADLREQIDLLEKFRQAMVRLKESDFDGSFSGMWDWYLEQVRVDQGGTRRAIQTSAAKALASAQAAGSAGLGAVGAQETSVGEERRILLLEKGYRIEDARRSVFREINDLSRKFSGEQENVLRIEDQIEDVEKTIARVRVGSEVTKEQLPALQASLESLGRMKEYLKEIYNPKVIHQAITDQMTMTRAVTEEEKIRERMRLFERTPEGKHLTQEDLYAYRQLNDELIRMANTQQQLRRSSITSGFEDQGRQALAAAMGLPTETLALQQQLVQLEGRRAALRGVNSKFAQEELKDLEIQIDGTKKLIPILEQARILREDRALSRELDVMRAITDEQRQQVELRHRLEDLANAGASKDLIDAYAHERMLDSLRDIEREAYTGIKGALVSSLTDGISEGGGKLLEIWKNVVDRMIAKALDSGISEIFTLILNGIGGGGGGGGGGGLGISNVVQAIAGGGEDFCPT